MEKRCVIGVCLILILLLSLTSLLYSADATNEANTFEYDATNRRDPFMPLITKDGKIAFGYGTIKSIEDIKLEGIAFDPDGESIAVINGLVLKKNDIIDNIKVIKIEPDKVTLLFNQTEHVIHLNE